MDKKIRILIAKPGLDGHDRGAKYVAKALRDAGMEVIYTGIRQTPEQIVTAAIQEDVDAVGLSLLSGAHNFLFPKVAELLKGKGADDILLFGGGVIPDEDIEFLRAEGFKGIFTPGATSKEIIDFINQNIQK
ncbi:MAG TPA: cobalamin B12-binding domain-containing protein [Candidatus Cloacimonetes bacterium]|nr:cobalamin B12-binding domain-containing protein [Candidatus Cloacimonadota bacterium]